MADDGVAADPAMAGGALGLRPGLRRSTVAKLADSVASASGAFVESLDEGQARLALLPFDEDERRTWAYWPTQRRGVPLWSLDRRQSKAAHRLLATLLTLPAYARAVTIMNLDEVLDCIEGYGSDRRHGGDYWITVFGLPDDDTWGVRFEGHHVSVHATVSHRDLRLTPLFLGANPGVVRAGGRAVIAPLGVEEQLGFELLHALSPDQRALAVVSHEAPDDILTRNRSRLGRPLQPVGVRLAELTGGAAAAASALLDAYLGRFPAGCLEPDTTEATFAWAGAAEPGIGHYYRVAAPRLLIELDNTQDGANHVHTVVRDPVADFGDDLLAAHHRDAHKVEPRVPGTGSDRADGPT